MTISLQDYYTKNKEELGLVIQTEHNGRGVFISCMYGDKGYLRHDGIVLKTIIEGCSSTKAAENNLLSTEITIEGISFYNGGVFNNR